MGKDLLLWALMITTALLYGTGEKGKNLQRLGIDFNPPFIITAQE